MPRVIQNFYTMSLLKKIQSNDFQNKKSGIQFKDELKERLRKPETFIGRKFSSFFWEINK